MFRLPCSEHCLHYLLLPCLIFIEYRRVNNQSQLLSLAILGFWDWDQHTSLKLVQIVNHYPGHFFHISCFQPVDLWGIQQNISQSAKILPLLQYSIPERCACMFHRAHVQMFLVRTCICMEPCEFFGSSLLSYELKFPIS